MTQTPQPPPPSLRLATLLESAARAHEPLYGGGLSNHLPMALVALHELGATDDELGTFSAAYAPRLTLRTAPTEPDSDVNARVQAALPSLLRGIVGDAFHGTLRLAFALRAQATQGHTHAHDADVSAALSYATASATVLVEDLEGDGDLDAGAFIAAVLALPKTTSRASFISERVAASAALPGFAAAARRLRVDDDTIPTLLRVAARAHAVVGDFTTLHVITGGQALLQLLTRMTDARDQRRAVAAYAVAAAAAFHSAGIAPDALAQDGDLGVDDGKELDAAALGRRAVQQSLARTDDHLCKFVWACLQLTHRDARFWALAARALG